MTPFLQAAPAENGPAAGPSASGTAGAIKDYPTSARHQTGSGRKGTWGGARNRADRTSDALTLHQARGIVRAAETAGEIGLPLNRHLTVHWERAGVPDSAAARATGRLLTLVRDWLRKRGQRTAWAWVRENGEGKGSHVHVLLHVPAGAPWQGWRLRRWVERVSGKPYRAGIVSTSRIAGRTDATETMPDTYRANLANVVAYVIKGASPDAMQALGLARREAGGRIIGKRAGWSENAVRL